MTLPVELLQRRSRSDRLDVVIVGAGVGGLVCGTILARAGLTVAILDPAKRPGGRLQTVSHQGYAIDLGESLWDAEPMSEALAAAGLEDPGLAPVALSDGLRVVRGGEGGATGDPLPLPVPGAVPSPSVLDAVRELYGVPPRIFASLGEVFALLHAASPEQREDWASLSVAAWLEGQNVEADVRAAVERSVTLFGGEGGESPVAALAEWARRLSSSGGPAWLTPGDGPIAGARSLVQSLVDAFIDAGGDLRLGTRAVGIGMDGKRFAVLSARREEQPFSEDVLADRCVLAVPSYALSGFLPESIRKSIPTSAPDEAPRPTLGVAWAVRGVPTVRGGELTPVIRVVPAQGATGPLPSTLSLTIPSLPAPRIAPPGHTLLQARMSIDRDVALEARRLAATMGHVRELFWSLFPGAQEETVFERHWLDHDGAARAVRPGGLPTAVPGYENVYLVGAHVEACGLLSSRTAAAAKTARMVAERVLSGA